MLLPYIYWNLLHFQQKSMPGPFNMFPASWVTSASWWNLPVWCKSFCDTHLNCSVHSFCCISPIAVTFIMCFNIFILHIIINESQLTFTTLKLICLLYAERFNGDSYLVLQPNKTKKVDVSHPLHHTVIIIFTNATIYF